MSERAVDVPLAVRQKAEALGPAGERWLLGLGSVIDELQEAWQIEVGSPMSGGTGSYVAHATTRSGLGAVLKICMPDGLAGQCLFSNELEPLLLADGRGYARLLDFDRNRRSMLLERLGQPLSSLGLPVERQIEVICATLAEAWVRVPDGVALPTGEEKAQWLASFIVDRWEELDRPCAEAAVARAITFADRRAVAFDPADCVLVHGDAHASNVLARPDAHSGPASGFKLIDPDGMFAERACDLAVPMREWNADLLAGDTVTMAQERCALLSRLTGVDPVAIWEWGFLERLSTGLFASQLGYSGAAAFLEVAERLTDDRACG